MEIDDGFIEFQAIQDQQKLQASLSRAKEKNNDLSLQRSKEELIEDYFNFCFLKSGLMQDATASMQQEHYFIVYSSQRTDQKSQDDLPVRAYGVTLTDYNGNFAVISPNNLQNDQLQARITPCFPINWHLAQKLQSTQLSISKILLLLNDLQTISQRQNTQDTSSIKSGSRRSSNDNL